MRPQYKWNQSSFLCVRKHGLAAIVREPHTLICPQGNPDEGQGLTQFYLKLSYSHNIY